METWKIMTDEIGHTLRQNGPLWSLREEWCGQAFQQAHAIRAMLRGYRVKSNRQYLEAARDWAGMTLRLQGTHGHPDRYNMGYGFRLRQGIPQHWFVADCGTVAAALLDVADLLKENDSLRKEIIASVCRFADYIIREWSMPDGSFSLGYYDFEKMNGKTYHCATAQSNLFLWPLTRMTGNPIYRRRALACTRWLANWDEYDLNYYGDTIHNRAYNGESMISALPHLEKGEGTLKRQIRRQLETGMVHWGIKNFGRVWFKNDKISHAKDPLLLMVLWRMQPYLKKDKVLSNVLHKGYSIVEKKVSESWKAVRRHNLSGMAIAIYTQPTEIKEKIFWPKFYLTEGLMGLALTAKARSAKPPVK